MSEQDDLKEGLVELPNDNRVVTTLTQDVEPYLREAHARRAAAPEHGGYMRKDMVYAATVPLVVLDQMANGLCCPDGVKYRILSPDPEESRRALLHLQSEHSDFLTARGKPFAKKRVKWE